MIGVVFDSSAMVSFLIQERGWKGIHSALSNSEMDAVMAGPALTETITIARRRGNQSSGQQLWSVLSALGVRVEHPTDQDLIRAAELIEIAENNPGPPHPRTGDEATLCLGDGLILAVAERLEFRVLTYDTYWKWMVEEGLLDLHVVVPE